MFEFTKLGVIFFAVGVTYMMTVGRKLVPDHRGRGDLTTSFGLGDYLTDLILQAGSKSVGRPLASAPLVKDLGIEVLQIRRGEDTLRPTPETILRENDVLRIQGNLRTINELKDRAGVAFEKAEKVFEANGARHALAVTRREFASFLLLVEEPQLAKEQLQSALTIFDELDCSEEKKLTENIQESIEQ